MSFHRHLKCAPITLADGEKGTASSELRKHRSARCFRPQFSDTNLNFARVSRQRCERDACLKAKAHQRCAPVASEAGLALRQHLAGHTSNCTPQTRNLSSLESSNQQPFSLLALKPQTSRCKPIEPLEPKSQAVKSGHRSSFADTLTDPKNDNVRFTSPHSLPTVACHQFQPQANV